MNRSVSFFGATALLTLLSFAQPAVKKDPDFLSLENKWIDSVFNSLTPDKRLGQLFMVAAYSNKDLKHAKEIRDLIVDYNIGGLIWMQGGPVRQGKLANYFQSISQTPLLYAIDGEWGLAMRLDSTPRYPRQMTLGAIQKDSLIYQMGRQIGKECKRLGLHVNFAPVADVNNNPLNPVIGNRSFGENKHNVARKAAMYMQGMQDERIMANAKHFPGHGDTDSDSHATLPSIKHSRKRLDTLELYPFRYLFDKGIGSVMIAHLSIPVLDSTKDLASTLSPEIVTGLLKNELGYKGLIFTDALSMKGVTKFYSPGEVDLKALLAGNDMLLFSENVPKAFVEIKKAIKAGELSQELIDERCRRILKAKYWCGLNVKPEIITRKLTADLNSAESEKLNERLAAAAITVLKNDNEFLPLKGMDSLRVAAISVGTEEPNSFVSAMKNYCYVEHIGLTHDARQEVIQKAFEKISECDVAIILLNKATMKPANNYGIGNRTPRLLDSIAKMKPSALVLLTNPYLLEKISTTEFKAVISGYEFMPSILRASANCIVGVADANGKFPVSAGSFRSGDGIRLNAMPLAKASAIKENFRSQKFGVIDSIALAGIAEKAYPGCQIVALKNGEVIYQKSFGSFTYNRDSKPVDNGTYYDLASLTKIAASSLALMKLRSEGKFDYKKSLGDYLPELKSTDKEKLRIEDVLSHQAGLQAWIPFYQRTIDKSGNYKPGYFSRERTEEYPIQVATRLFASSSIKDTIYKSIINSKLEKPGKYLYSDLGYYFMQQIVERQSGKQLNEYVHDIYASVGLGLRYRPLQYFSKLQVAPTEKDQLFRKQVLQGYVHDPGAAMLGGVAGHAGLFGNALDMARLMQLYLNKGQLNGVRVLDSNVVKEFTTCRFCPDNRRGLCFDKSEPDKGKDSPVTPECSPFSFGHSGFTGTFAWADPVNNLVVVFLSNRVFPGVEDNKLARLGIRTKIHKAFYDALK